MTPEHRPEVSLEGFCAPRDEIFSPDLLDHEFPNGGADLREEAELAPELSEQLSQQQFIECATEADFDRFVAARAQLPEHFCLFLSPLSKDEFQSGALRLFLMEDGQAGYGLRGVELVSVFSLPGAHRGPLVAADAVARGAQKLDFLDANGKVARLYLSMGFREVARYPWDETRAPSGWDYARWGRPDFVVMERRDADFSPDFPSHFR